MDGKDLTVDKGVFLTPRRDALAHEGDADGTRWERPWLVISRPDLHGDGVFAGAFMTTGKTRSRVARCVARGNEEGYIDTQQLWLFEVERAKRGRIPVASIAPLQVREKIAENFTPYQGSVARNGYRRGLSQGAIVWVSLSRKLPGDKSRSLGSHDIDEQKRVLTRLGAAPGRFSSSYLMPAMVLTSDRYLPPCVDCYADGLYPLVTVVPISSDPELISLAEIKIKHPNNSKIVYAPVCPMLLSLDYMARNAEGKRVETYLPGYEGWRVSREVLGATIHQVMEDLNVPEELRP